MTRDDFVKAREARAADLPRKSREAFARRVRSVLGELHDLAGRTGDEVMIIPGDADVYKRSFILAWLHAHGFRFRKSCIIIYAYTTPGRSSTDSGLVNPVPIEVPAQTQRILDAIPDEELDIVPVPCILTIFTHSKLEAVVRFDQIYIHPMVPAVVAPLQTRDSSDCLLDVVVLAWLKPGSSYKTLPTVPAIPDGPPPLEHVKEMAALVIKPEPV
jgi:hypothetical protein